MAQPGPVTLTLPPFPPLVRGEFHWEGVAKLSAWAGFQSRRGAYASRGSKKGSSVRVSVAVEDPVRHTPAPEQVAAFEHLLDQQQAVRDTVLGRVYRSYSSHRAGYADDYDIDDPRELERVLPTLSAASELNRVIGLSTVHLSPVSLREVAYVGLEFGCNWDEEHGLGVLLHKRRVVAVGHADVCFLEWVAERDAKEQVKRRK